MIKLAQTSGSTVSVRHLFGSKNWATPVINLEMNLKSAITVPGRIKYIKWLQESLMAVIKFSGWQPDLY